MNLCTSSLEVRCWWCDWNRSLHVVMSRLQIRRGGGCWCYKKTRRSRCGGRLLFFSKEWSCVGAWVSTCVSVGVWVPVHLCVCSGADDKGRGLHTRGTTNEKEAFPPHSTGHKNNLPKEKWLKSPRAARWKTNAAANYRLFNFNSEKCSIPDN